MGQHDTVALVSGGLDSATALWWAKKEGYNIARTIHIQYGQSHAKEMAHAHILCEALHVPKPEILKLNFEHLRGASALLPLEGVFDIEQANKVSEDQMGEKVSATYVPGRNIVMLALMGGIADAGRYGHILGGWNAQDYSGYPDCRPRFLYAMEDALRLGLRWPVRILAPLVFLDKASIIRMGRSYGVPYDLTWSCYQGGELPCGACPSCKVRAKGFAEAGIADPALPETP